MNQTVPIGQLVADRFRIVRFIAEGGMGEVYEAEDTVLEERVALKFLNHRSIGDERVMRRFRREIQLARKVTHRNVCRLHDVYSYTPDSGLLAGREVAFVSMELLAGETLEDAIARDGRFSEERALPLILQMAEALTAAHHAGVIHRDFKPSNVMLVPSEADETGLRAVVTDFGLARPTVRPPQDSRTPLTGETRVVGTADYMSPEQLYGEDVTPASDVYAMGVVVFEMMTARKPYSASNPMSLLAKRVSEPPASPLDFAPDLDPSWAEAIGNCMKSDVAERTASPRDLVVELSGDEIVFSSQPSGTIRLPSGFVRQRRRPARRRQGFFAVAAVILAALAGLAFWGRVGHRPAPPVISRFNPQQLTTSAGLELDPTFSPSGDAIAYSSDQGGTSEIYVRDLTPGGRERRLTMDGGQNFEPAWSPDGTTIAFHSKQRGGIWLVSAAGDPVAGGPDPAGAPRARPRQLTRFGSRPTWSPDGTTLAFQSESAPLIADTAAPALALSTIWLIKKDGSERRQLTRAGEPPGGHAAPAFSPDGRRLAFSASPQREASEIWAVGLDGEDPILLSREPATGYDPIYARDGRGIYFSARTQEVNALWHLPLSRTGTPAGPATQVRNLGLASIRQLAVSADGTKMAYAAIKTISNLRSLPLDADTGLPAGESVALTHGTGRNNRPAFSPDGRWLAFDRWQHGLDVAVWMMDAGGADLRQITVDRWSHTQPSWFPTGDRLAFQWRRGEQRIMASIEIGSGRTETLAELDDDVDWARLSPDGARLAYHSRGAGLGVNLWLMDLDDGGRRQLTFAEELMGFPCWSHDGRWLAFQRRQGEDTHLMVMSADGGEPVQLTSEPGQSWPFSFSPDSRRIAFAARRGDEWSLWWISREGGERQRLTAPLGPGAYVRYPAWSPRGDRLVYELAETTGDVWLVRDD